MRRKRRDESLRSIWSLEIIQIAAAILVAIAVVVAVAGVLILVVGNGGTKNDRPRALILDQLTFTIPNPDAIRTTDGVLREAGFDVEYIPGEDVTVERYRSLAADDYDLIILRSPPARSAPEAEVHAET